MKYDISSIQPLGVELLTLSTDIVCSRLDQNRHTYGHIHIQPSESNGIKKKKKQNVYFGLQSWKVCRHNIGTAECKRTKMPLLLQLQLTVCSLLVLPVSAAVHEDKKTQMALHLIVPV